MSVAVNKAIVTCILLVSLQFGKALAQVNAEIDTQKMTAATFITTGEGFWGGITGVQPEVATGVSVSGNGTTVTFTGSFNVLQWTVSGSFTVSGCSPTSAFNTNYTVATVSSTSITAASSITGAASSGCTLNGSGGTNQGVMWMDSNDNVAKMQINNGPVQTVQPTALAYWFTNSDFGGSGSVPAPSANIKLVGVGLPYNLTSVTTGVGYIVASPDNTTNSYDIGIYGPCSSGQPNCPLVVHIGPTPGTTFAPSSSLTALRNLNWAAASVGCWSLLFGIRQ